jgi:hypothetical protein
LPQNIPEIPEKLLYARVRELAWEARCRIRATTLGVGFARREAGDADPELPLDWRTVDLLTLALDLADDPDARNLLVQARTQAMNLTARAQEMSVSAIVSVPA